MLFCLGFICSMFRVLDERGAIRRGIHHSDKEQRYYWYSRVGIIVGETMTVGDLWLPKCISKIQDINLRFHFQGNVIHSTLTLCISSFMFIVHCPFNGSKCFIEENL